MPDLTTAQKTALTNLTTSISTKKSAYMTAYNAARTAAAGGAVVLTAGATVTTLWNELVALRQQRNDLLAQHRAAGIKI